MRTSKIYLRRRRHELMSVIIGNNPERQVTDGLGRFRAPFSVASVERMESASVLTPDPKQGYGVSVMERAANGCTKLVADRFGGASDSRLLVLAQPLAVAGPSSARAGRCAAAGGPCSAACSQRHDIAPWTLTGSRGPCATPVAKRLG